MHALPSLLIIDDHPIIRAALADALRRRFPRVRLEAVGDAESGIALLKQEVKKRKAQSWCVLIDLGLPGISGLAAITQLRALSDAVQVIAISGNDDALQVGACFGAGAAAFISKAAPTAGHPAHRNAQLDSLAGLELGGDEGVGGDRDAVGLVVCQGKLVDLAGEAHVLFKQEDHGG